MLEPDPDLLNPDPKHCFVPKTVRSPGCTTQTFRNQDLDLMKAVELEKSGSGASPRKKEKKVSAASQNVMAGWLKKETPKVKAEKDETPKVKAEKDEDSSRRGEDEENILRPQLAEEVGILIKIRYGIEAQGG
jgi:hypothetical protein